MHLRRFAALLLASIAAASASAASDGSTVASPAAILFERDGDLYAISLDGSRTVRLTNTPVWHETDPAASPDGRGVAFSRRRGGGSPVIWVMSLDGAVRKRLTSGFDHDPAWSPDGRTIYFSRILLQSDRGPNFSLNESCGSIYRTGADGTDPRRLTNPPWKDSFHHHGDPAVSPDGRRIAFTDANQCSGGTTSFALRVVDQDGQATEDLSRLEGNAYYPVSPEYASPSWSPDGEHLVLGGDGALYVAHRTGSGARRLTPKGLFVDFLFCEPSWSPDGAWIAFLAGRSHDLYVIRPDGTGLRRLVKTAAREASPSWLPALPRR